MAKAVLCICIALVCSSAIPLGRFCVVIAQIIGPTEFILCPCISLFRFSFDCLEPFLVDIICLGE